MATHRWIGAAQDVAGVWTFTPGGSISGETFTITLGNRTISFTDTAGTVAGVVTGLYNAWVAAALLYPEFDELTPSDDTTTLTATAKVGGVPHTFSVNTPGGSATFVLANTTAVTGKNWVDNAANYDIDAVPGTNDDLYIDNTNVSLLYGLDQITQTLDGLYIGQSFGGDIGLPKTNALGYPEYRDDYWTIRATIVEIGNGRGTGSRRIKLDLSSVQSAVQVYNTGAEVETGIPALLLKGTHASNVLDVQNGSVGAAFFGGEAATFLTVRNANGNVILGDGCTLTNINVTGGQTSASSNVTTLTQRGGTTRVLGAATVATLDVEEGLCDYLSSGTITTLTLGGRANQALLSFAGDGSPRTITNTTLNANARIDDPGETVTYTNAPTKGAGVTSLLAV